MKYRTIGADPAHRREVSVLALGAMLFGSRTDEATSFAVLDRYVEAGGNFIDTSDNYAFWVDGSQGGQSEKLLGRWRRSRGIGDEIVIATKLGARPLAPGSGFVDNPEGLSAKAIRESADRSRERLGVDKLDVLYAHIEDRNVPLQETVEGFAELVAGGTVGLLGASNHAVWRVERARALAAAAGLPGYEVLQYQHSYLRPGPTCRPSSSPTAASAAPARTCSVICAPSPPSPSSPTHRCWPAPTRGRTNPCAPSTTTRAPPPASPRCGKWRRTPGRVSIRWCWPGSWAGRCRSCRSRGRRRWPSWRRTSPPWTWS